MTDQEKTPPKEVGAPESLSFAQEGPEIAFTVGAQLSVASGPVSESESDPANLHCAFQLHISVLNENKQECMHPKFVPYPGIGRALPTLAQLFHTLFKHLGKTPKGSSRT